MVTKYELLISKLETILMEFDSKMDKCKKLPLDDYITESFNLVSNYAELINEVYEKIYGIDTYVSKEDK